jgi:tetratricopeptide (TPR) repeat protein
MKKLIILISILFIGLKSSAYSVLPDSTVRQPVTPVSTLDSLKQQLQVAANDTVKSALYTQLAAEYLKYDNLEGKEKRAYQAQALNYSYLALHLYSAMNDTTGLRTCFNSLAKVYRSQRKYPQAKWFILQSNTLSRAKNDVPNILESLIVLANIKMEIKDYSLAMRDLNEALTLSKVNHFPKVESNVQESYVLLYTHLKNYTKADIAAKRHDFIEDSLLKDQEKLVAKTQDTLQVKKKVLQVSRKLSKTNYSRRIASL